jgi:hypothetical protein
MKIDPVVVGVGRLSQTMVLLRIHMTENNYSLSMIEMLQQSSQPQHEKQEGYNQARSSFVLKTLSTAPMTKILSLFRLS